VGEVLAQVLLDTFQVQFKFESGSCLVAAFRVEHVEPNGTAWPYGCEAWEGPPLLLHRLLQHRVAAVAREDLCLTLTFDDGSALRVFSDLGPYESGKLWTRDGDWIVF
jgi:hypothetical protein